MDISSIFEKENIHTLYISLCGSRLYGTYTDSSDYDYRGIFIQSPKDILLGNVKNHLTTSFTHTLDLIDVQLWSLQYWLQLLHKGDTNAIDLLYSWSSENTILYTHHIVYDLFMNANKLFNIRQCTGYIGYALQQAKRFGIKTQRFSVYKVIYDYLFNILDKNTTYNIIKANDKLEVIVDRLIEDVNDSKLCYRKETDNQSFLVIAGTYHLLSITIDEFYDRIKQEYFKYGNRVHAASKEKGHIDWKAISHCVRALCQMQQLLTEKKITFPLQNAKFIQSIKLGKQSWSVVEEWIQEHLWITNDNIFDENNIANTLDQNFINDNICKVYKHVYSINI